MTSPSPPQRTLSLSYGAPRPATPRQPGCLAGLLLEISGVGFLLQMRRRLGTPLFLLAVVAVLGFMFLLGARVERYAHIGEHQYVLTLLPTASCFSPLLALLMAWAFALGDSLTNATYWLFPNHPVLNLYRLFGQPAPLLTWGAYVRMGFITLPLFAVLPGLGSRIAYAVASRVFAAGRARIVKDGGDSPEELQRQLEAATRERDALAARQAETGRRLERADNEASSRAEQVRALEAEGQGAHAALAEANSNTTRANEALRGQREQTGHAAAAGQRAAAEAGQATRVRERAEAVADETDARLRLTSNAETEARERVASLEQQGQQLGERALQQREHRAELAAQRQQLGESLGTGVGPDGRPLDAAGMADLQRQAGILEAEQGAADARLAATESKQAQLESQQAAARADLERRQEESARLLEQLRAERERAEQAAEAERAAQERAAEQRRVTERQAEEMRAAEAAARESQTRAEEAARRVAELNRAREQALAAAQGAASQRNEVANEARSLASSRADLDQRVTSLADALGVPPPVAPQAQTGAAAAGARVAAPAQAGVRVGSRSTRTEDPNQRAIRDWDQRMYAEMERARVEREAWLRAMQDRYAGSLPSGLGGGLVAGIGEAGTAHGLGSLVASSFGALVGAAVGGGILRTHMWAEYNPIREILHPTHTRDVACYKMDVRYLDDNILSGIGTSAAAGPVAVVTADTGGPVPGGGLGPSDKLPDLTDRAQTARDEADRVRKQWEESEATADKSDPGYQKLKDQYDGYIKSKEDEAATAEAEAARLRAEQDAAAQATSDAQSQRQEWLKGRQDDVKALEEEKAHLAAVLAGAAGAGFDVSDHQRRLDQINGRLGDLHTQLQKEGADISYTARDRGVIAPGKEFVEGPKEAADRAALLDQMQKWRKAAFDHGMLEPGAGGQRGDIYGKLGQIINGISEGKMPDRDQLDRIREHMDNRIKGVSADTSQTPPAEKDWWRDGACWGDALTETGRNLTKGETSSGETSWIGMGGRILIGGLTGGASELVLIPAGSLYTMKDAIDRGESGWQAFGRAVGEAGLEWAGEKVFEGGLKVAAGGIKGGYFKGWSGAVEGAGEAAEQVGKDLAEEASDLVNPSKWGKSLGVGGAGGGGEPPKGDGPDGGGGGGAGADAPQPKLTPDQRVTKERIEAALESGDPAKVRELYQDCGMKKLADCQRAGGVPPETAAEVNRIIGEEVNDAVRCGTRESITEFQDATQVKLKEVLVGDSGSSAKGPVSRLKTDADRTLVPVFDKENLRQYANRNNISVDEAYNDLSRQFRDVHQQNVERNLIQKDLMPQDVGYGSYDRIGGGAGPGDAYPEGFTSARQATQGTTDVYRVSPDGNQVADPYRTSGQALVDQNQLNNARYDPCRFDGDATRIPPEEVPGIVDQQVRAIEGKTDPESVAKALSRTGKAAAVAGDSLANQRAVEMAEYIRNNPGWSRPEVEQRFGMKLSDFVEQGKQQIYDYDVRAHR